MPLPSVVKFNIKLLAEEAKQRGHLRKSAKVQEEFGFDGRRFLSVPFLDYLNHLPFAQSLVKKVDEIKRLDREHARIAAFNQKFTDPFLNNNVWTTFLIEWKRHNQIASLQKNETDLLDVLFNRGLSLTDIPQGFKGLYKNKLIIEDDRDLQQIVFDLQTELDRQERISDFISAVGPRVTLAVAGLFPPTAAPAVVGFAIQGVIGLLQFFAFMQDAEADDYISEEEAQEAWWQLAGILPFFIIGIVVLARVGVQITVSLGEIGIALLEMLMKSLQELPDTLANWNTATEEGWSTYGDINRAGEIFIPSYAINDLKRIQP